MGELCGYDIASKLEDGGTWKQWLSEKDYEKLKTYLASPAEWNNFISLPGSVAIIMNSSKVSQETREEGNQAMLQLRVRCLLFDRVVDKFFSRNEESTRSPNGGLDLQLNDIYLTLDEDEMNWKRLQARGSQEISALQEKYHLTSREGESSRRSGLGEDEIGQSAESRQKQKFRASRELSALMPDVKPTRKSLLQEKQSELNEALERVISDLKALGDVAEPFLQKVKRSDAPDYYQVIKRPMDLGTMLKKLRSCKYMNKKEFQSDLDLIAYNCRQYNEQGSLYTRHVAVLHSTAVKLMVRVPDIDLHRVGANEESTAGGGVAHPKSDQLSSPESHSPLVSPLRLDETSTASVSLSVQSDATDSKPSKQSGASKEQEEEEEGEEVGEGEDEEGASTDIWYDRQLRSNLSRRLEIYASRSSQMRLPFGDQNAIVRDPQKMADFLEKYRHGTKRKLPEASGKTFLEDEAFNWVPEICIFPTHEERPPETKNAPEASEDVEMGGKGGVEARKEASKGSAMDEALANHALRRSVAVLCSLSGFHSVCEGSLVALSELLRERVVQLGRGFRALTDRYGTEKEPMEVLSMCLEATGNSSVEELNQFVTAGAKPTVRFPAVVQEPETSGHMSVNQASHGGHVSAAQPSQRLPPQPLRMDLVQALERERLENEKKMSMDQQRIGKLPTKKQSLSQAAFGQQGQKPHVQMQTQQVKDKEKAAPRKRQPAVARSKKAGSGNASQVNLAENFGGSGSPRTSNAFHAALK